jgi:hypothetical protein
MRKSENEERRSALGAGLKVKEKENRRITKAFGLRRRAQGKGKREPQNNESSRGGL